MATMNITDRVSVWKEWSKPVFISGLALLFGILFSFVSAEKDIWMDYWSSIGQEPNTKHLAILFVGIVTSAVLVRFRAAIWGAATMLIALGIIGAGLNAVDVLAVGIVCAVTQLISEVHFYIKNKWLIDEVFKLKSRYDELKSEHIIEQRKASENLGKGGCFGEILRSS